MTRIGIKTHLVRASAAASVTPTAVVFPSNLNTGPGPTLFRFSGAALIQSAPATYIWRAYWNQQNGYYTTFFYDTDTDSAYNGDSTYFGCHPYPYTTGVGATGEAGADHHMEISYEGHDTPIDLGGVDDNGHSTLLTTGRWYRQAAVMTLVGGKINVKFYWDIEAGSSYVITGQFANTLGTGGATTSQALSWGASPWSSPQDFRTLETMNGRLRGLQLYATNHTFSNIALAAACESDAAVASLGLSSPWYWNVNPTPSDISDKSGNSHSPAWVDNTYKGTQWTGP